MAELHDRYIPEEWEDYPSEETPIDAESLNHIEQGISNNSEDIEAINEEIEAINEDITNTTRYRVVSEFTGEVPQRDADLLGGHVPSYYATKQQLDDEVAEINDSLTKKIITKDNRLIQISKIDSEGDITYTVLQEGYYSANVQLTNNNGAAGIAINGSSIIETSAQSPLQYVGFMASPMLLGVGCQIRIYGAFGRIYRLQ